MMTPEKKTEAGVPGEIMTAEKKEVPALCPKSANPYTYCPLVFVHEDDMILSYVNSLAVEIKRINGHDMRLTGDDATAIDRYTCEITAYMNGRIHELVKLLKEQETRNG